MLFISNLLDEEKSFQSIIVVDFLQAGGILNKHSSFRAVFLYQELIVSPNLYESSELPQFWYMIVITSNERFLSLFLNVFPGLSSFIDLFVH
jgi:hypothetical protein